MKILVLFVALLSGCAPLTEEQRFEREDALIVAQEEYAVREVACRDAGGVMVISGWSSGMKTRHSVSDYRLAQCIRY